MKEYKYTINGNKYVVEIGEIANNVASVTVNGEAYSVEMEPEPKPEKPKVKVQPAAPTPAPTQQAKPKAGLHDTVKAPLPGVITTVCVAVGDEVKVGDTVVVLEAMKMQNNLETEKAGKVSAIYVQPGQSVMEGDPLVAID